MNQKQKAAFDLKAYAQNEAQVYVDRLTDACKELAHKAYNIQKDFCTKFHLEFSTTEEVCVAEMLERLKCSKQDMAELKLSLEKLIISSYKIPEDSHE